jgi:hypothetical protein
MLLDVLHPSVIPTNYPSHHVMNTTTSSIFGYITTKSLILSDNQL